MAKIGMHFIKIQVNRETIIVNYVIDEVVKYKMVLEELNTKKGNRSKSTLLFWV